MHFTRIIKVKMLENFYSNNDRKGFHWPGRIYLEDGGLNYALNLVEGYKSPLLIIDQSLEGREFASKKFCKTIIVKNEPTDFDFNRASSELTGLKIDAVLAVGGGSTIDLAKSLSHFIGHGCRFIQDAPRRYLVPKLIAVPSVIGSGSETSRFFVISSDNNGLKNSYRSWANVPDLTVIDPSLISSAGRNRLILGAFDCFLHLWETLVCRNEKNPFSEMLALTYIPKIILALENLRYGDELRIQDVAMLAEASACGGIAISNVRTGLLHTLGESLASQISLPHPLTLQVFFRNVFTSYEHEVKQPWDSLRSQLDVMVPKKFSWNYEYLVSYWEEIIHSTGAIETSHKALSGIDFDLNLIYEAVKRDTVLLKENPKFLSEHDIQSIIKLSLQPKNYI